MTEPTPNHGITTATGAQRPGRRRRVAATIVGAVLVLAPPAMADSGSTSTPASHAGAPGIPAADLGALVPPNVVLPPEAERALRCVPSPMPTGIGALAPGNVNLPPEAVAALVSPMC